MTECTPEGLPIVSIDTIESFNRSMESLPEKNLPHMINEWFTHLTNYNPTLFEHMYLLSEKLPKEYAEESLIHMVMSYELIRRQAEGNNLNDTYSDI